MTNPADLRRDDETLDAFYHGRIRVLQKRKGYRFSVDAPLLADFVRTRPEDEALDLGTGSGIIALLLSAKPYRHVTALEIQAGLADLARRNIELLHGWSRNLTRRDLVSVLQFAVLSFIVLPILPNRDFGPYQAVNPHQVWLMVVLISGVSLAGYVALRVVGQRYGAPLLGLLGGLVSSTATTVVYSRHGRADERMAQLAVAVIVLANLVLLARIAFLGGVVSPGWLPTLLPVLGAGFVPGLLAVAWLLRTLGASSDAPVPEIKNPTELRTSLTFGALYALVLFLSAWLSDLGGSRGLYFVAIASGTTDVDAITLSSLRLFELGKLGAVEAATAIGLAILSNIAFKLGLVAVIGGPGLARRCAPAMLAYSVGLGAGLLLL